MSSSGCNGKIRWDKYGYWIGEKPKGNEKYKRVSTIKNKLGKGDLLTNWAARMVAEKAQRLGAQFRDGEIDKAQFLVALLDENLKNAHNEEKDVAADFGTIFHDLIEGYAANDQDILHKSELAIQRSALLQLADRKKVVLETKADEFKFEGKLSKVDRDELESIRQLYKVRLWPDIEALIDWCDEWKPEWIRNEFQVFSDRYRYAGSVDALARVSGSLLLIDHKTSKSVYEDYGLQLAAYRYADYIAEPTGEKTPIPTVDGGCILHIRDGKCNLYEIPCGDQEYAAFLACHQLYWWEKTVSKFHTYEPKLPFELTVVPGDLAEAFK